MTAQRNRAAVLVALVPVLALGAPAPVAAHTTLIRSSVEGGAVPADTLEVVLEFSGDVRPALSTVVVTGSDGRALAQGRPSAVDGRVVQPLAAPLPAGSARLAYRVVSSDGHPLTGTLPFRVTATSSRTTSGGPAAAPPPAVPAGPADDPADGSDGLRPGVLPVAGLGAGLGLLGLLLVRRRTARL